MNLMNSITNTEEHKIMITEHQALKVVTLTRVKKKLKMPLTKQKEKQKQKLEKLDTPVIPKLKITKYIEEYP